MIFVFILYVFESIAVNNINKMWQQETSFG